MVKVLQRALAAAAELPDLAQERIGLELLAHIEKLQRLRHDLSAGLRSLDQEHGRALDVKDVLARARRHAKG